MAALRTPQSVMSGFDLTANPFSGYTPPPPGTTFPGQGELPPEESLVDPGGSFRAPGSTIDDAQTGSSQSPRDRQPGGPVMPSPRGPRPPISPPSSESQMGGQMAGQGAMMMPQRPMSPSPMAGAGAMGTGPSFTAPTPFELSARPESGLYGKAGGLLHGGYSATGSMEKGEEMPSELLALLALLGQ